LRLLYIVLKIATKVLLQYSFVCAVYKFNGKNSISSIQLLYDAVKNEYKLKG